MPLKFTCLESYTPNANIYTGLLILMYLLFKSFIYYNLSLYVLLSLLSTIIFHYIYCLNLLMYHNLSLYLLFKSFIYHNLSLYLLFKSFIYYNLSLYLSFIVLFSFRFIPTMITAVALTGSTNMSQGLLVHTYRLA